jgi:NADPH:quinone reductase-like Zn-dependent oxidoreductase
MKAIIYQRDGSRDVLKLEEVEKPAPADDEVLIKVRAASVNPLDCHLLKHRGLRPVMSALSRSGWQERYPIQTRR